jgi:hypothetical protein
MVVNFKEWLQSSSLRPPRISFKSLHIYRHTCIFSVSLHLCYIPMVCKEVEVWKYIIVHYVQDCQPFISVIILSFIYQLIFNFFCRCSSLIVYFTRIPWQALKLHFRYYSLLTILLVLRVPLSFKSVGTSCNFNTCPRSECRYGLLSMYPGVGESEDCRLEQVIIFNPLNPSGFYMLHLF